mmetsp:Transcript_49752/g.73077  ORF Transcript_49752/g.73077 Transcript_49752/m.73077 type:complete len:93 (+) Transcript_49752:278-556(+)
MCTLHYNTHVDHSCMRDTRKRYIPHTGRDTQPWRWREKNRPTVTEKGSKRERMISKQNACGEKNKKSVSKQNYNCELKENVDHTMRFCHLTQ